jgi:hypothetical protein
VSRANSGGLTVICGKICNRNKAGTATAAPATRRQALAGTQCKCHDRLLTAPPPPPPCVMKSPLREKRVISTRRPACPQQPQHRQCHANTGPVPTSSLAAVLPTSNSKPSNPKRHLNPRSRVTLRMDLICCNLEAQPLTTCPSTSEKGQALCHHPWVVSQSRPDCCYCRAPTLHVSPSPSPRSPPPHIHTHTHIHTCNIHT